MFTNYRGYILVVHPSGPTGIYAPNEENAISTALNLNEAKGIIDSWKDAP